MRHILIAAAVLGIATAAHAQTGFQTNGQTQTNGQIQSNGQPARVQGSAQTNAQTNGSSSINPTEANSGIDPLAVPTSSVPTGSSAPSSTSGGGGVTTGSAGSTAGISASANTNPQAPLQLSGENLNISPQAPATTGSAPSHASPACPPSIPTTDGGSANLSPMVGGSLGGC
jgi:hypothetical protein